MLPDLTMPRMHPGWTTDDFDNVPERETIYRNWEPGIERFLAVISFILGES